ncbi:hypothetical protein FNV43_RR10598 [Rhamnella rubrinervis]|uniref:MYB transcription factor n=1 Tax=Rhamnella rubrinervis TaxID=2594499 RepID=A0A8K0H462_9ROSA|nr:hypothetical protein FNV43_RR10598 [Rhamnella rubrinervis]
MEGLLGVRKGAWTKEEDDLLKKCVEKYGEGKWHQVPSKAGLNRCRKSCRLRWLNYLKADIRRGEFTVDEVDLLLRLHKLLGNRWSLIAGRLPGRTANDVKNYWNTHLRKKYGKHIMEDNKEDHQKTMVSGPKVIKPRPRTFTKRLSLMNIGINNIASTTTTTSMDSKNNFDHQEENNSDPISPLEKDIKWWESLLYDTLEANEGKTCSTGSGSDGEPNKMEKISAEQVEPAAAGSNIGIKEAFVEDHKSLWRDLISMDIDLWDL